MNISATADSLMLNGRITYVKRPDHLCSTTDSLMFIQLPCFVAPELSSGMITFAGFMQETIREKSELSNKVMSYQVFFVR